MIDVNLPLELDDGREAILESIGVDDFMVSFAGTARRNTKDRLYRSCKWWFYKDTGVFVGDVNNSFHTIRNRNDEADYVEDFA